MWKLMLRQGPVGSYRPPSGRIALALTQELHAAYALSRDALYALVYPSESARR